MPCWQHPLWLLGHSFCLGAATTHAVQLKAPLALRRGLCTYINRAASQPTSIATWIRNTHTGCLRHLSLGSTLHSPSRLA